MGCRKLTKNIVPILTVKQSQTAFKFRTYFEPLRELKPQSKQLAPNQKAGTCKDRGDIRTYLRQMQLDTVRRVQLEQEGYRWRQSGDWRDTEDTTISINWGNLNLLAGSFTRNPTRWKKKVKRENQKKVPIVVQNWKRGKAVV